MTVKTARKVPFLPLSSNKKYSACFFSQNSKMLVFNSYSSHIATHGTLLASRKTTGSNKQHAKPQRAVSYAKNVFSCSLRFLNSCSWLPPAECTRAFEQEGKREEDRETSFEPCIFAEIQEANSQHIKNVK